MAIDNYQGGGDAVFNYGQINRTVEREQARQASVSQAKAKQAEDQAKEIAGMVAKINQDGLRNADIPKFSQKYGEIQTWASKIRTATTIEERATASAEFNQKVQDIGLFVNRSKNYSKQLQSVAGDYLKDTQGYSEETGTYYKTQFAKPLDGNTDNDNIDISSFKKLGNVKYVEDRLLSSYKNAGKGEGAIKVGSTLASSSGTTIKNTNQTTQLNREEIANDLLFQFTNDWQVRDVLNRAYPNAKSPEEKIAAYMVDNRGRETTNNAGTINLSNKSAGSGGAGTTAPLDTKGSEIVPIGSSGDMYEVRDMERFSPTTFNLVGTKAYDLDNNEEITLGTVEDGVKIGEISVKPYMKNTQTTRPVYKNGKLVGRETEASGGELAKPEFAKANPNLIEWKATAIGTYKDATLMTKNVTIPVRSLPKDKKGINERVARAIENEKRYNQGSAPKPVSNRGGVGSRYN